MFPKYSSEKLQDIALRLFRTEPSDDGLGGNDYSYDWGFIYGAQAMLHIAIQFLMTIDNPQNLLNYLCTHENIRPKSWLWYLVVDEIWEGEGYQRQTLAEYADKEGLPRTEAGLKATMEYRGMNWDQLLAKALQNRGGQAPDKKDEE
jgi:hypothetical protein